MKTSVPQNGLQRAMARAPHKAKSSKNAESDEKQRQQVSWRKMLTRWRKKSNLDFEASLTFPPNGGLPMNPKIIITCAVTGAGDTVGKSPNVPVTPEQIANSALEAASAGAAVVHCHVRDPKTGKGARGVHLYKEVMERIRAKNKDVIINLTAGMGGDLEI